MKHQNVLDIDKPQQLHHAGAATSVILQAEGEPSPHQEQCQCECLKHFCWVTIFLFCWYNVGNVHDTISASAVLSSHHDKLEVNLITLLQLPSMRPTELYNFVKAWKWIWKFCAIVLCCCCVTAPVDFSCALFPCKCSHETHSRVIMCEYQYLAPAQ